MKIISRTKALLGLGTTMAALAVAVPVAASAAPAARPAPHSVAASAAAVGQNTQGCQYVVNANHIHMYKTPGGQPNGAALSRGQVVSSAPRTVVAGPHHTNWVFVIRDQIPAAPVGFVNKTFLNTVSCRTPAHP
jgi:hypothetical protein